MMQENGDRLLREKLKGDSYDKLVALHNRKLQEFVADAVELCNPESVFVCTDSEDDIGYIRGQTIALGEERRLDMDGHTVHFDGYHDQGRDKGVTKYLLPPGTHLGKNINAIDRAKGLAEVRGFLKNSMAGKQMFVRFFCLGPTRSEFSMSGVQLTDSAYVAHSEDLLFRPGYNQFKFLGDSPEFFRVLHSAGEIKHHVSVNVDKRRVYIDPGDEIVYTVNTQYAGNTVGFKKLSLRLAIRKADREGWLAEHMFIMGVHGPNDRVTYFTGAFPSACGKTSTAMISGETIIGDDLALLRRKNGGVHAANTEAGVFGIIKDVNPSDDPVIWKALTSPGEVIFSNVLIDEEKTPYWLGDGREHPEEGVNFSGKWHRGKTDENGDEIPSAHKNARYTIRLRDLRNLDERWNDPEGVPVGGIIYGGRDSDTWVPVQQSFDWAHGVITMGAALESETTAATLGAEGIRTFQPMSNLDFVSIPLGQYVQNHLNFAGGLDRPPIIFAVNYFLRGKDGEYLNGISDKNVWIKWMERRVHGEVEAIRTPTGWIPRYENLNYFFRQVIGKAYPREDYIKQFTLRIPENLEKIERIKKIYAAEVLDTPQILFHLLDEQARRLKDAQDVFGDYISPFDFER